MADQAQVVHVAETVDRHMVAIMRCLLAMVGAVIVYVDPHQARWIGAVWASLAVYSSYSVALFIPAVHRSAAVSRAQPWVDVLFFAYLVALTQGIGSVFFHYFLFAIVVASFSRGFVEGISVTMVAVLSFAAIGLAGYAAGAHFELAQALTRSVSLFILGYLISYWGGHEISLRRRLSLLTELTASANPRARPDNVIASNLSRLLEFFDADGCVLVCPKPGARTYLLYRADRASASALLLPDEVSDQIGRHLLALPQAIRVSFDDRGSWLPRRAPRLHAWGPGKERCDEPCNITCAEVATLLEVPSFATVPYKQSEGIQGRLYLTSSRKRFSTTETEYLAHVVAQMGTAVNNLVLLDDLTRSAAQQERSRISRDIHDTTVQSYIGLKLGLEALYRDISPTAPAASRIKELLDMATLTVDDLRGYVDRLRGRKPEAPDAQLVAQLEEQQRRYRDYHGIQVELRSAIIPRVSDQLAAEAYRVVCEALSNVFRHTSSKQAFVDLRCDAGNLAIEVGNDSPKDDLTAPFMPRSITERAMSLGGRVQVRLNNDGHDIVRVTMPLNGRDPSPTRDARAPLRAA